jgi:pyruvate dehydrogenase E2 component (dihydrolipoamide acetyltransferase)
MIKEITLPDMGNSMKEGMIVSILIAAGQTVSKGQKLFEIETSKASLDMDSPENGIVEEVLVGMDEIVPVGAPLLRIRVDDDCSLPAGFEAVRLMKLGETMQSAVVTGFIINEGDSVREGEEFVEIETDKAALGVQSPVNGFLAAKIAKSGEEIPVGAVLAVFSNKQGLLLSNEQKNSLVGQNELAKQIESISKYEPESCAKLTPEEIAASVSTTELAASGKTIPLSKAQKIVGESMAFSKQNAPCFYLNTIVEVDAICALIEEIRASAEVAVTIDDALIKAAAMACLDYPNMTGRIAGTDILLAEQVDIALTSEIGEAILAPVCRGASNKSLVDIASERISLVSKAKAGELTAKHLEGACMTITNLGALGVEWFIPIVVPKQASAIGVGHVRDELMMRGRNVESIKRMALTISVDHKVVNGAYAAQFLDRVRENLETPENLCR